MLRWQQILSLGLDLLLLVFSLLLLRVDVRVWTYASASAKSTAGLWVFLDVAFAIGFLALQVLDFWMIREVNRKVTEGYRLDYFRWDYWSWSQLTPTVAIYEQIFPDSRVGRARRVIAWMWLPFVLVFAYRIRFTDWK